MDKLKTKQRANLTLTRKNKENIIKETIKKFKANAIYSIKLELLLL